jgi:large subunit ribosomal protein L24
LKVFTQTDKILVEGVNVVKRHIKKQGAIPGQVIEMEKPINASNVQLVCPFT